MVTSSQPAGGVVAPADSRQQAQSPDVLRVALEAAGELVLPVAGASMGPAWEAASGVVVRHTLPGTVRWGSVVVFERHGRWYAHRVLARLGRNLLTKGDARWAWDRPLVSPDDVWGVVVSLVVEDQRVAVPSTPVAALLHVLAALVAWPLLIVRQRV